MNKFENLFAEYPCTLTEQSVKSAVEVILANHFEENNNVVTMSTASSTEGALRVLAAAKRDWSQRPTDNTPEFLENDLCFVGLTGMIDPVRPEVKPAIEACAAAGIRGCPVLFFSLYPKTSYLSRIF